MSLADLQAQWEAITCRLRTGFYRLLLGCPCQERARALFFIGQQANEQPAAPT